MALALDPCPANDGCKLVGSQRSGLSPLGCHLLCFSSASGACPKLRQLRGKNKNSPPLRNLTCRPVKTASGTFGNMKLDFLFFVEIWLANTAFTFLLQHCLSFDPVSRPGKTFNKEKEETSAAARRNPSL